MANDKKRQFKENTQSGEHRNGRKSQDKNNNAEKGEEPNEFLSKKDKWLLNFFYGLRWFSINEIKTKNMDKIGLKIPIGGLIYVGGK